MINITFEMRLCLLFTFHISSITDEFNTSLDEMRPYVEERATHFPNRVIFGRWLGMRDRHIISVL